MEIIFELLFEFVFQVVVELLFEAGFRGVAKALSNRVVRVVLGLALAIGAGYGGGYWWGSRLSELGRTEPPNSLWVSIGLAVAFAALALVRAARTTEVAYQQPAATPQRTSPLQPPWRWSPMRLLGFALLNAAVATGIDVGFTPRPSA